MGVVLARRQGGEQGGAGAGVELVNKVCWHVYFVDLEKLTR